MKKVSSASPTLRRLISSLRPVRRPADARRGARLIASEGWLQPLDSLTIGVVLITVEQTINPMELP